MRNVLLFGLAALVLTCTATVYGDFVAYNDLAGSSSGNVTAINLGNSGTLIDYVSGGSTGVTLAVTGTDVYCDTGYTVTDFAGGDALTEFGTIVNNNGYIRHDTQTAAANAVLTFTGMNPDMLYTLVVTGARGNASYPSRGARFTISDAGSYLNASSAGVLSGADWAEFNTGDNTTASTGYVARFRDVRPGPDGDLVFTITPGLTINDAKRWYVNEVKLSGMVPEPSSIALLVAGGLALAAGYVRRRQIAARQ